MACLLDVIQVYKYTIHQEAGYKPVHVQRVCTKPFFSDLGTRLRVGVLLAGCFLSLRIVCVKQEEGFHLDLDDFLMGLLTMCNELVNFH